MFTSIANNFGAPQIVFDDYQSDILTVLNAHFDIDPTRPEYSQISQFEITVPNLVMKKSAVTAVFLRTDERTMGYGTILKSWIKDRNTIVIEKYGDFEQYGTLHIDIVSAYVVLGRRGAISVSGKVDIPEPQGEIRMRTDYRSATVMDGWMYFFINFKTDSSLSKDKEHIYTIEGLPEDTDCDVPIVFCGGYVQKNGSAVGLANIKGNKLTIKHIPEYMYTANEGNFINAFIVRKGVNQ